MAKDITATLEIHDLVRVMLKTPLTPVCVGSETRLGNDNGPKVSSVTGGYVGSRPGIIKVDPIDGRLLNDGDTGISRYVVIGESQIREVYRYGKPEKVFP
jgi:hypothetical protein